MNPQEHSATEARLKHVLQESKSEYEATKKIFSEAVRHLDELGYQHPDGVASLDQAAKAHNRAFRKYREALLDFNRFILDGKPPEWRLD